MPWQRLIFSDTDPQSTDDNPNHSGTYDSDSDLDPSSHRKIGLAKPYGFSKGNPDSRLPTNRAGDLEAAAEESFAGGVGKTEVGYELLSHPPLSSLPRLAYMLIRPDYP